MGSAMDLTNKEDIWDFNFMWIQQTMPDRRTGGLIGLIEFLEFENKVKKVIRTYKNH